MAPQYSDVKTLRYTSYLVLLIVTILLTLCDFSNGQDCQFCVPINDCACKCSDGRVVDISKVGLKNGKPRFPYQKPNSQPSAVWEFAFNPCYSFSDKHCKKVVACQRSTTEDDSNYELGKADSAIWATDASVITYTVTGDDMQLRTSILTLTCDPTGLPESPTFSVIGEEVSKPLYYDFALTSICACPDGCKSGGDVPGGGGGGGGLSFGSILCILFSVLVVVYIIGGMIFMKVVKKAEGKELVPNVSFWMELPNYIKEGFLFLKNKITGGSSSTYEAM